MSASTTPTRRPSAAIATARFAVSDDLPTPPLPDAIAYTFVSEPGCENGMTGSPSPPRSCFLSRTRCSGLMTPISTDTDATPSTADAAAVTSSTIFALSGQPAVVRSIATVTSPAPATSTSRTMPSSVMGRRISGSMTVASAARTASTRGG